MKYNREIVIKRIFSLVLVCTMVIGSASLLASCSKKGGTTTPSDTLGSPSASSSGTSAVSPAPTPDSGESGSSATVPSEPEFTPPEEFVDEPVQGIYVEYYNGKSKNTFVSAAVCETIGGTFGNGTAPVKGMNRTNYSIVWSGRIKAPYTGTVKFTSLADDGVTVTIDKTAVIVDGGPHLVESHSGTMEMEKDRFYDITVEYYNGELGGSLSLKWSYDGVNNEIPKEYLYLPKYPAKISFAYNDSSETVRASMQRSSTEKYTLVLCGLSASGGIVETIKTDKPQDEFEWEATMKKTDSIKSFAAYVVDKNGKRVSLVGNRAHKEDIRVTVDPQNKQGSVSGLLYGACMEDVNHELYGGIWSQMIFGEHFEESPTSSADDFKMAGGNWAYDKAQEILSVGRASGGPKLIANNTVCTNGSISADVYVDGDGAGFLVKTSNATFGADAFDGYEISLFSNMVRVAKHQHNYKNIKDTTIKAPLRTWVNLKVEVTEKTITVFINGEQVYSYTDTSPIKSGAFGFRAWNASAKYKNVKVSVENSAEQSLPFEQLVAANNAAGMWQAVVKGNVGNTSLITTGVFAGKQDQRLTFTSGTGAVSVNNMGLNRMGMNLEAGKDYNGYFYAKSEKPLTVYLAFESKNGSVRYGETEVSVSGDYKKYSFSLTPSASDDTGRFVIEIRSAGTLDLGYVFLEPGEWGLYKGLHVRRDVAELYEKQGISVLRFGGLMANVDGWKWKNMTGAPETRDIYKGYWYDYSSYGFGIIEFLDLCEALGVEMIPDFSSYENPKDMADFIQFALGTDPENEWVKLRKEMGREQPYNLKYIQIGNEDKIDTAFAKRFNPIANAIWKENKSITLIVGDFEYTEVINDPMRVTGASSKITALVGQRDILKNAVEEGGRVYFDIHFWSQSGAQPVNYFPVAVSFYNALKKMVPDADTGLCVLELNAMTHDFERALCNAMAISNAERVSDIIKIMCSANALQVDKQNDNGWDQGLIFMDNTGAWYQSPAYVDRMFYDCHLSNLAAFTASEQVNNTTFDITAMVSDDGKTVSVKIVNRTGATKGIGIDVTGFGKATMTYVTMKDKLNAQNTTEDKFNIKPEDAVVVSDALNGKIAVVESFGYSVTTVVFTLEG